MDDDNLLWIISWIVIIAFSVFSKSSKKKSKKNSRQPVAEQIHTSSPVQIPPLSIQPAASRLRRKKNRQQPPPVVPESAPLPQEGMRVTVDEPEDTAPAAPKLTPRQRLGLDDRDNLRKMLIFNMILDKNKSDFD